MWLNLGEQRSSSIENQFIHCNSASYVDAKWSKSHGDLMRPCRVIVPAVSKKVYKVNQAWLEIDNVNQYYVTTFRFSTI